ncbi:MULTISPECIES: BMC domain-containing protein [Paenibacillus]|uniref:Bacterial microcompartment domain-containing protein n=1 Tax=Paenibacillus borealis TaxID=160799 RepID=A0ABX3H4Z3_PAEBO|nr:BMC domain-containing protein [Paenibacillus borealis]OMD45060.1 hypothetical protein BSK56_20935 [Paenibacillus borealis]
MNRALATVKVRGLADVIRVCDLIVKNTYVELVKVLHETMGGSLVIIFRGSLGQVREAEALVMEMCILRNIDYELNVIPNFDFDIVALDSKGIEMN